jgi:hypothetical protein
LDLFISPVIDTIILITAIINVAGVLLLFFSCRFLPGLSLANPLTKTSWYKPLYKYHSYIWCILFPSFLIHATLAIAHRLAGG